MSDEPTEANGDANENHDNRRRTEEPMTDTVDDETELAGETSTDESQRDLQRTANYALLAGLSLLALIATLQLYFNVSSAINRWISYEYRSLFQAAFNLAVLLLTSAGIVWQVRRLRE